MGSVFASRLMGLKKAYKYNKIKDIPKEKQTSEIKTMIETYNKTVDYIDFDSLNEIVNEI